MDNIILSDFVPYELIFDPNSNHIIKADDIELKYSTRKLFDMKDVIYDKEWVKQQKENIELYYMYRDFTREDDKEIFQKYSIRFDITIIPPNKLGSEYVKTAGHFHPEISEGLSYPEVYEVMSGKGLYLLQKEQKDIGKKRLKKKNIEPLEVIVITAKKGDQILIPPGYGHVTINPSNDTTLVMNNLVSSKFSSLYDIIEKKHGASYFYHRNDVWFRNPNYNDKIILKEKEPKKVSTKPFYLSFLENPESWIYLNEPWARDKWL
ncbi:MAG: glucose-6-phosphate isomerase [Asgard group archaeon]|nr:glucose-6-phosphate isomerase [Asgard group archaeon]